MSSLDSCDTKETAPYQWTAHLLLFHAYVRRLVALWRARNVAHDWLILNFKAVTQINCTTVNSTHWYFLKYLPFLSVRDAFALKNKIEMNSVHGIDAFNTKVDINMHFSNESCT